MSAKIAKAKVWKTADGTLVEDGHPDAVQLVARRGESIPDDQLKKLHGVDDFFVEANSQEATAATAPLPPKPPKIMTREEIDAYRMKHKDEHPFTGDKVKASPQEASTRGKPVTAPQNKVGETKVIGK